jgi:hypothetical protein
MSASSSQFDRTAALVQELQQAIQDRYPEATFAVRVGPDGRAYLSVYTDAANDFAVLDLVTERTVDAVIQDDVKVHVFPRRRPRL